jgi:alkanesulfonate monooxygenase SsuD/methylene tetrahydromethanopterin reductase-like flavin-dependent oxidoreductase (luciferase family)
LEDRIRQTMRAEGISFAEAIRRPRNMMVGTPAMIADSMQDMFETEACDGFVLTPTISPVMWEEFARMLTPGIATARAAAQRVYGRHDARELAQLGA